MKNILLAALLTFAPMAAFAQIAGTAHDFSGAGWNTTNEICVVCHAPHNNNNLAGSLLWNHQNSTATYNSYSSPTMDSDAPAMGFGSLVCLSCHDGTVAIDSFGGAAGTNYITGNALLGTDLSNDHPVGITWPTTDPEIFPDTSGFGAGTIADVLYDGRLECATCHDVHGTGIVKLLRLDNTNSALCFTCHDK